MLVSRLGWKKKADMPSIPSVPAPQVQLPVLAQKPAPQQIQYIIKQDDEEEKRYNAMMLNRLLAMNLAGDIDYKTGKIANIREPDMTSALGRVLKQKTKDQKTRSFKSA